MGGWETGRTASIVMRQFYVPLVFHSVFKMSAFLRKPEQKLLPRIFSAMILLHLKERTSCLKVKVEQKRLYLLTSWEWAMQSSVGTVSTLLLSGWRHMRAFLGERSFLTNTSPYHDRTINGYTHNKDKSYSGRGKTKPSQNFSLSFRPTLRNEFRS